MSDFCEFEEIVPGHKAAAKRLLAAQGSIHEAWDSLDVFDWDAALNYLRGSPGFQAHTMRDMAYVDAKVEARLTGLILGFAITAVEADREVRGLAGRVAGEEGGA